MPNTRRIKNIKPESDDYYEDYDSEYDSEYDYVIPVKINTKKKQVSNNSSNFISQKAKNVTRTKSYRSPLNVVVCGTVDAGKSTLLGHLLILTNTTEKKVVSSRELAWILDQGEDEHERGITIDPTKCQFNIFLPEDAVESDNRKIKVNIIDTPGHRGLMNNLILGAVFANVAVIIVGYDDFTKESNFGDYFREHFFLLYFLGVRNFLVCINKLDKCGYSCDMYDNVATNIRDLCTIYSQDSTVIFIPTSGLKGVNLTSRPLVEIPWYSGPCLLETFQGFAIDSLKGNAVHFPENRSLCHVFDMWESGKNVCCSCFVENSRLKVSSKLVALPREIEIKCVECVYSQVKDVDLENCANITCKFDDLTLRDPKCDTEYINDFVDIVNFRGAEIANLIHTKLLVDSDTFLKIKSDSCGIKRQDCLTALVHVSYYTQKRLTIGDPVEFYVGYFRESATVQSLCRVSKALQGLVNKKVFSMGSGEFGFIVLKCQKSVFVEPVLRDYNRAADFMPNLCSHSASLEDKEKKVILDIKNVGILSKILIRSSGGIFAGGVLCHDDLYRDGCK